MMVLVAHSTPKTSVSFLRLFVAASRIEYTQSPSQVMHKFPSFSSKNSTPYTIEVRTTMIITTEERGQEIPIAKQARGCTR